MQEAAVNPKLKLWMAALKPPMYTVAVVPISVGTAVAYGETRQFDLGIYFTFLGAAILIIAWLNLTNDVFDADTGIDKNKAHSVVNLTGNQSLVFWVANLCLVLGILGIVAIALLQKDLTILALIVLCCALGYTYQGPPFRLGYQGLGEPICFVTFGPLAIAAAYYSQTQSFSTLALAAGTLIGISTSIILFCSHFHQVNDDLAAGKRSPIVRLGTALGAKLVGWTTASLYGLTLAWVSLGLFSPWTLLVFASLPFAIQLVQHVQRYHDQPERVSNSKFFAVNLQFVSGVLLALSFIIPPLLSTVQ
jgi:2-carboxy-1,4-naphthoquinone phytyltransferase